MKARPYDGFHPRALQKKVDMILMGVGMFKPGGRSFCEPHGGKN